MTDKTLDLISLAEAVRELGVTRPTLYKRIDDNHLLRYTRIGDKKVYLLRADVEKLKLPQLTPNRLTRPERKQKSDA